MSQPRYVSAGRPARLGTRARLVLVALAALCLSMLIGGAGLAYLLEDGVETSATDAAAARAVAVADVITGIGLSEAAETAVALPGDGSVVQIITPDHGVLNASHAGLSTLPMVDVFPGAGAELRTEANGLLGSPGEWAVVARGVAARGGTYVVQVATPITASRAIAELALRYLFIVMPVLLIVTGIALWLVVGRTLSSVESIRRRVAHVDARSLATRVEVPRTRDEIAALAETMNDMLDRLERSDTAQRRFVSDASHELRGPLATATAAAELAVTAPEARRSQLLRTISVELDRLHGLQDDLMMLARLDGSPAPTAVDDVDLDDLLHRERVRLRATSELTIEASLEPVRIRGDAAALSRATRNLVDNAELHARSAVRLTVLTRGDEAVVQVDNDGPVIAPKDRLRVFDRFQRLDESRARDAGGSGLGLAIVLGIVERHGGTVAVVDAPDGWCRFEIRLPLLRTVHAQESQEEASTPGVSESSR